MKSESRYKLLNLLETFGLYKNPNRFVGKNAIIYMNGIKIGYVTNVTYSTHVNISDAITVEPATFSVNSKEE